MIKKFVVDAIEITICFSAAFKYVFKLNEHVREWQKITAVNIALGVIATILAMISLIVIVVVLLLPLAAYRKVVDVMLTYIHKKNYGGLIGGLDNLWAIEDNNARHTMYSLLYLEHDESQGPILTKIKRILNDNTLDQFTGLRKHAFGYIYRLLNQVTMGDLIQEWNLSDYELSSNELLHCAMSKISNKPMPENDTAAVQVLVSNKPIKFGGKRNVYVLFTRVHHSVGDGTILLGFLLENLSDEKINVDDIILKKMIEATSINGSNKPRSILYHIDSAVKTLTKMTSANYYYFPFVAPADCNSLRGPPLSGDHVFASLAEETPGYLNKIKSIKNRVPGCTFSDVVLNAVSAALYEYFKKSSDDIPKHITLSFVYKLPDKNVEFKTTLTGEKEYKLGNHFSVGSLLLPIDVAVKNPKTVYRERLARVQEELNKCKNGVDLLAHYWLFRGSTVLPVWLTKILFHRSRTATMVYSNTPGIQAVHAEGQKLRDLIVWLPTSGRIGLGIITLSYDDRFQISLIADKVLIPEYNQAKGILDEVINSIDKFDKELTLYP